MAGKAKNRISRAMPSWRPSMNISNLSRWEPEVDRIMEIEYYRSERSYGSFVRNIELPETEDAKEKETKLRVE